MHSRSPSVRKEYSCGCDVKSSKGKSVLCLPHSITYCSLVNSHYEGNGIIRFLDDNNQEVYVLFANWKKGNLCGKSFLYNTCLDRIESVLFFSDGKFVKEMEIAYKDRQFVIIDSDSGYRWEGYTQKEANVSRGSEYNEFNDRIFSGWYYEGSRLGKGECYFGQNRNGDVLCNRGHWHSGREYGPFEVFDRKGHYVGDRVMIGGEIVNTCIVLDNPTILQFSSLTESLTILSFEGKGIDNVEISDSPFLKELIIGDKCFLDVRSFLIQNHKCIEQIKVGEFSFYSHDGTDVNPLPLENRKEIQSYRKKAVILNCPQLQVIDIGCESFVDFLSLELSNLPSLQTCMIGHPSDTFSDYGLGFFWCNKLCLQDLPSLKTLHFGNFSFFNCSYCMIKSMFSV